ncbi:MAG: hypothetical protein HYW65_00030 [Candidatus Liptonbacteria bacterium]|nr:hypothetical protein [Candidatus Liptonbacteria bacterium]MBI3114799.1 hypothetical protein [Candidatus Harrisonbacteria bacterium]
MKKFLAPLSLALMGVATRAFAGSARTDPPSVTLATNKDEVISNILCPIARYMFWLLMVVSVIMILYAAFLYMTAEGGEEKVSKAHKIVAYAAVGIVVALLSYGFPFVVGSIFGYPADKIPSC